MEFDKFLMALREYIRKERAISEVIRYPCVVPHQLKSKVNKILAFRKIRASIN